MRRVALGCLACLAVAACDAPRIVDCAPGRFVQADGRAWCVYERSTPRCPSALPVEHDLPWGDRGCAAEEVDPLPDELCQALGECGGEDAGL